MGEVALCRPLTDSRGALVALKAKTSPYPEQLGDALLKRFRWEPSFAIDNAEIALARGEQTHVAGCAYRALACTAQVLFALNGRYLTNEKGALQEAASFPKTIPDLIARVADIWRSIGEQEFTPALSSLRDLNYELKALA
jgi:hypothetical protein